MHMSSSGRYQQFFFFLVSALGWVWACEYMISIKVNLYLQQRLVADEDELRHIVYGSIPQAYTDTEEEFPISLCLLCSHQWAMMHAVASWAY